MTPAGTSNELDVQNGWEENTHTHTHCKLHHFQTSRRDDGPCPAPSNRARLGQDDGTQGGVGAHAPEYRILFEVPMWQRQREHSRAWRDCEFNTPSSIYFNSLLVCIPPRRRGTHLLAANRHLTPSCASNTAMPLVSLHGRCTNQSDGLCPWFSPSGRRSSTPNTNSTRHDLSFKPRPQPAQSRLPRP